MLGDALWALAACLMIESVFGPVARIISIMLDRAETQHPPHAGTDPAETRSNQKADL